MNRDIATVSLLALVAMPCLASTPRGPVVPCPEGAEIVQPALAKRDLPAQWTFWSRCKGFVGTPIVELLVTAAGKTADLRILRSSGCEAADRELIAWLKRAKYTPGRCGDEPVAFLTTYSINWHPGYGTTSDSVDERQHSCPVASAENTTEEKSAPATKPIAGAQQEMESARRQLVEQVRRERQELPTREGAFPAGKVRELAREEIEEALQLCRTAPRQFVEAEVDLNAAGEAQSVELRTESGEQDCDQAVIRALEASSWAPCEELGEPAPCRVSYALSLGSHFH